MTKSGAPSLISDIRYFSGGLTYVKGCHAANANGKRVAHLLRSRDLSFGPWTHLYIRVAEGNTPDTTVKIGAGVEWWHHFADLTVPTGFSAMSEPDRDAILVAATRRALHAALPDSPAQVDAACDEVAAQGEAMRFLVKRKIVKGRQIDLSFNLAEWPAQSNLFVAVTDSATQERLEAAPVPLQLHTDIWSLAGNVLIDDNAIVVTPKTSLKAQVTTKRYKPPLVIPLSSLRAAKEAPVTSSLIRGGH